MKIHYNVEEKESITGLHIVSIREHHSPLIAELMQIFVTKFMQIFAKRLLCKYLLQNPCFI